ncbi:uncharacterized protein LOC144866521 isoform X2 [Branchiostoma floridae x Branchiostoma japonicum]
MAAGLNLQRTVDGLLYLNLSNQGLTSIPEEVFDITDLESINVSHNKLTSIPEAIGRLQKLSRLDAGGNKLTSLPQAIGTLPKLTHLYVYDNKLTKFPTGVCLLLNLEVLSAFNNNLSTFPPGVEKLQKLRELYVYDNQLTEVPPGVCSLPNLEVLSVGMNPIRRLPDDVTRLTRLKDLSVPNCLFDEFPRQVLQLKTLEKLYAGGNKFDIVPGEVGNLQHLLDLALEHNLLRTLPSTMSHLHNLREVLLRNNKFDTFPKVLCELPAMEILDIRYNNITRLPTALHRADKLKDLVVSGNPLTYPPQDVRTQGTGGTMAFLKQEAEKRNGGRNKGAGPNLQPQTVNGRLTLDLSNQGLTSIPEEAFDITDLEVLDVSDNKLTSIPEAIGRLQKLYRLDAHGNMLTSLPQEIGSLQKLTHLYVHSNKLANLPPGIEKLQKLRQLYICGNQLTEVPSGVCSLPNLEVLHVGNNKLSTFPPGVEKLQKLRELYIYGNRLTEVPSGVCSLPNLEVLSVGANPIRRLPDDVTRLTRLKTLYVDNCQFDEFPRQVLQLKKLGKLYADGCKFDTVPDEVGVGNLQHLWYLSLSTNLLRTLPSTMSHLHNLREVHLSNNKFDTFPKVLCELPVMFYLYIRNNKITRLPTALYRAGKLKDLDVSGNPLTYPPWDVRGQGFRAIMAFLKEEAEKEGTTRAGQDEDNGSTAGIKKAQDVQGTTGQEVKKGSVAGKVTKEVRDVEITPVPAPNPPPPPREPLPPLLSPFLPPPSVGISCSDSTLEIASSSPNVRTSSLPLAEGASPVQPQTAGLVSGAGVGQKQPTGDSKAHDKDLNLAFSRLALKVKPAEWKHIARQLGFNNQEVKDVATDCPDEPMYETLVRWRERAGPAASLAVLERCLRDLDLHQLADQITRTAMSPTRRGHESGERGAVGGQLPGEVQSRYPSVTVDHKLPIIEFERLNFPKEPVLGSGGFAAVEKAYHLDLRQEVAVKRLLTRKITGSEQDLLYSEARKLNLGSRSDHVISLLGVCLDPNFAIVMPYMENGSLAGLLRDVDVPWALRWRMAHEISLGMTFLHCQNPQILHCDLKAENVLLDGDFHVKISDFGLSKWKAESRVVTGTSPSGSTITHAPPEYHANINLIPTAKFDVYSFGVLLWEIVTRRQPYAHAANSALISINVERGQRPDLTLIPTDREDVTSVSQLMQTCWSQNPDDRPSFDDCADRLRHVKDRFSREDVRQAISAVEKMQV